MNVMMSVPPSGFDDDSINRILKTIPWNITHITLIQSAARGTGKCIHRYALDNKIGFSVIEVDWNYSLTIISKYDAAFVLWNGLNRRSESLINVFRNTKKPYYIYNTDEEDDDEISI